MTKDIHTLNATLTTKMPDVKMSIINSLMAMSHILKWRRCDD